MKRLRRFAPVVIELVCLLFALFSGLANAQFSPPSCSLSATPSSTPPDEIVQLQGSCSNTTAFTIYQWSGPGTSSCSNASKSCSIVAPSTPGIYTYTIKPSKGSSGRATVTVVAPPPTCTLAASPTNPAPNATVQLQGSCTNLPSSSSFAWSGPGTNVCSATSPNCTVHAPAAPGPATYTLTAAYPGGTTIPASATINVSGNLTLVQVSGNNQSAAPGKPLANPLVVRLVDAQGAPVSGVGVSWTGSNPRDRLSATTVTTDPSGLASITVTLSGDPGARTFTATAFGSSVVFTVRGLGSELVKPARQLLVPMTQTAITATRTQLDNVTQHLDDVRQTCNPSGASGAAVNGMSLGRLPGDGFVAGEISIGRQTATDQLSGYKLTTKGVTIGGDVSCGGDHIVGVAIGFFRGDTRFDDGSGDQDAKGASVSLWGSYMPLADAYFDIVANFGHNNYDSQRHTTIADLTASTRGDQVALAAKAGYRFKSGRTQFDPYFRVEHIEAKVHGFGESGGTEAIAVSDVKAKSTVQSFGGKLRHTFDTSAGEVTPHARLEVHRQTQDSSDSVMARFVASPDVAQALTLPQNDHSYGNFAIGASGLYGERYDWYLNYERSLGNSLQSSAFTARLRIRF